MKFKNLILDLDNTLYGYNDPHQKAILFLLNQFSKEFKVALEEVKTTFQIARKKTHLELPNRASSHNRLLYVQKLFELFEINSLPYALKYYNFYWDTFLDHMTLFDGVDEILKKHKSNGGKICILTDLTSHIQYRKIEKLKLYEYVDFMVTSEEVGIEKPHPLMFSKALQKLNSTPEQALMIGDNWEKDIIGANNTGISSIWLNDANKDIRLSNVEQYAKFNQIEIFK